MNSDRNVWTYRHYVANSLQLQSQGRYYTKQLREFINPKPEDTRSPEEITADFLEKTGIKLKEE